MSSILLLLCLIIKLEIKAGAGSVLRQGILGPVGFGPRGVLSQPRSPTLPLHLQRNLFLWCSGLFLVPLENYAPKCYHPVEYLPDLV